MTLGDAAQLAVAVIALVVAVIAIRRDGPDVRARWEDGAAGTAVVLVTNVGLRPIRIEALVTRKHRFRSFAPVQLGGGPAIVKPFSLQPADATRIALTNFGLDMDRLWVEDAAGKRYRIRQRPPVDGGIGRP